MGRGALAARRPAACQRGTCTRAPSQIVWPRDWKAKCLGPPAVYAVRAKMKQELEPDVRGPRFVGDVVLLVKGVPDTVTEDMLRAWVDAGVTDEDMVLKVRRAAGASDARIFRDGAGRSCRRVLTTRCAVAHCHPLRTGLQAVLDHAPRAVEED